MMKRVFDLVVSAAAITAFSPLMAAIAVLVRATSPGPVLHRARRAGRGGVPFELYKFRSMEAGARRKGPRVTGRMDPRVTPLGRLLRKTKLDELPQLINVLKGEMSLVGPRPEDPHYVALYTPEQRAVLRALPGITSPASVAYRHEEKLLHGRDWEEAYRREILPAKLAIELAYLEKRNFLTDLKVLWETFLALFRS